MSKKVHLSGVYKTEMISVQSTMQVKKTNDIMEQKHTYIIGNICITDRDKELIDVL